MFFLAAPGKAKGPIEITDVKKFVEYFIFHNKSSCHQVKSKTKSDLTRFIFTDFK